MLFGIGQHKLKLLKKIKKMKRQKKLTILQ